MAGARTPLFSRHQPGGLFSIQDVGEHPGDIFFVDSATGTDGAGYGQNPDSPVATIDYAIGLCTANKGDVIYVLPGHAETINTAGGIEADKAGISIIGLGNGEDRPTVTVGSTLDTATVLISAADVKLRNLILQPGNDGVDILLNIDADGALIEDCEFREDAANAYQVDNYVDVGGGANGADRTVIRRCKVVSIAAGAVSGINIAAVEDALVIEDCWIDGDFSGAGIESASVFTSALIKGNVVSNRNAGNHAIEFSAACTGMLVDNRLYGTVLGTILDPGSLKCLGNLETDAIDQAGVDSPRTSAGGFPDSSITAAVFAAGAIDAAAIANGAIDAATFAASAIDATAIAADAITNAKIADNAIATEQLALSATEKTTEGVIVTRATAALPQTTSADIFTVTGLIKMVRIVGYVTVVVGAIANATKLVGKSTGAGADTDLCATLDINGHVADSRYEITGTFANAMVRTLDVPLAKTQVTDIVIPPGTIAVDCAGSDGGTGRVRWSITYVPMESGAQVVAA